MTSVDRASKSGCFAFILHQESKCNTVVQIALVTLTIVGIVIASFSYCGYLPFSLGHLSLGFSVISLIFLGMFKSYTSTALDRRIDQCESFEQLKQILDATEMRISYLGKRYLIGDAGQSTVDHLAKCVERKIAVYLQDIDSPNNHPKKFHPEFTGKSFIFSDSERTVGRQLIANINQLFDQSETIISNSNAFTYLCYYIPKFFKSIVCYNDIRNRYQGETCNGYCMIDTIQVSQEEIIREEGRGRMPRRWRSCLY